MLRANHKTQVCICILYVMFFMCRKKILYLCFKMHFCVSWIDTLNKAKLILSCPKNILLISFKLRSSMTSSNRPLRATVGQNSSSVQMAAANHVGAAVLVHMSRSGRLDDVIDEQILSSGQLFEHFACISFGKGWLILYLTMRVEQSSSYLGKTRPNWHGLLYCLLGAHV